MLADESVNNAKEAGEVLSKIVSSCTDVMDMVHNIASATEEQSREISERVKKTHEDLKKHQSKESFDKIKSDLRALRTGVSEREFWAIVFDII